MTEKQKRDATRELLEVLAGWECDHAEAIEITRRANMAAWEVANPESPHTWESPLDDLVDVACRPPAGRTPFRQQREDHYTYTVEGAAAFERHRAEAAGEGDSAELDRRDAARER
jgi:hypothetical protein